MVASSWGSIGTTHHTALAAYVAARVHLRSVVGHNTIRRGQRVYVFMEIATNFPTQHLPTSSKRKYTYETLLLALKYETVSAKHKRYD